MPGFYNQVWGDSEDLWISSEYKNAVAEGLARRALRVAPCPFSVSSFVGQTLAACAGRVFLRIPSVHILFASPPSHELQGSGAKEALTGRVRFEDDLKCEAVPAGTTGLTSDEQRNCPVVKDVRLRAYRPNTMAVKV